MELISFFIFNSSWGPNEGEEEGKIVYYYPKTRGINFQIRDVGLVEALIQFARTFESDVAVQGLQTLKTRHIYLEPEPDFNMVLVVGHPSVEVTGQQDCREYRDDVVHHSVFRSLLQRLYGLHRLVNGPFSAASDPAQLRTAAARFYDAYLATLRVAGRDVCDIYGGVAFLPLERHLFLQLETFVSAVEDKFAGIRHTIVYYGTNLVWSGLNRANTRSVHHYLSTVLFPECSAAGDSRTSSPTSGVFMSTETAAACRPDTLAPPIVHLETQSFQLRPLDGVGEMSDGETQLQRLKLIIYRCGGFIMAFTVPVDAETTMTWCKDLAAFVSPKLQVMSELFAKSPSVKAGAADNIDAKFVYYNDCNMAQKSTLHDSSAQLLPSISTDSVRLIADLRDDMARLRLKEGTVCGKLFNSDVWVAGSVSCSRELFTVVEHRNMHLIDLWDHVNQLCRLQFGSVFFKC